jgi:preprotein translocase subunit SecG
MYTFVVIIHVIVCFLMISSILLQAGKGAEIGAAFGGSSQTVFGSRGPASFLSKVTVGAAVIFMVTSLSLAILSKERTFSSTVIDLNKKESSSTTSSVPAASDSKPADKPSAPAADAQPVPAAP